MCGTRGRMISRFLLLHGLPAFTTRFQSVRSLRRTSNSADVGQGRMGGRGGYRRPSTDESGVANLTDLRMHSLLLQNRLPKCAQL